MPLVPNFSATQSLGSNGLITLTDTSTGSDSGLTTRRVYIRTSNGTYLVQSGTTTSYELWALPLATAITLNVLSQATAASIRVDYMTNSTVTYTKTILWDFDLQLYLAGYNLTRSALSNPSIVQDQNYYANKMKLIVDIDDSENAVSLGGDIVNAQSALDRGTYLVNNAQYFY